MSRPPLHDRRLFRGALAASLGFHLALVLIPASWWHRVSLGGGGSPLEGPPGEAAVLVSLFEDPGPWEEDPTEPEPEPPEEPLEEPPEPELPPEPPEPEPEGSEERADLSKPGPEPAEPLPTEADTAAQARSSGALARVPQGGSRPGEERGSPGEEDPTPRFHPPRLLTGALPLDPDDVGDLEVEVPEEIPVRFRVGRDGRVLEVVPSDPDLPRPLLEAIRRSARDMRFVPARMGDRPVEGWFALTYIYRR
jgi:protein TonB